MYEDSDAAQLSPSPSSPSMFLPTFEPLDDTPMLTARQLSAAASQPDAPLLESPLEDMIIGETELMTLTDGVAVDALPDPSNLPPDGSSVHWDGEGPPPDIIVIGRRDVQPSAPELGRMLAWTNYSAMVDMGIIGIDGVITPTRTFGSPPVVGIDPDVDPGNLAEVQAQQTEMMNEVVRLTAKIDSLPDTAVVFLADGSHIDALDLKELWADIDFVVTDQGFGPGRGGAYDAETNISTFTYSTVSGWDDSDQNGLAFIILHEVVHSSRAGIAMDAAMKGEYHGDWDFYYLDPHFEKNEEFANDGALEIAEDLGIAPRGGYVPTYGYEYGDMTQ